MLLDKRRFWRTVRRMGVSGRSWIRVNRRRRCGKRVLTSPSGWTRSPDNRDASGGPRRVNGPAAIAADASRAAEAGACRGCRGKPPDGGSCARDAQGTTPLRAGIVNERDVALLLSAGNGLVAVVADDEDDRHVGEFGYTLHHGGAVGPGSRRRHLHPNPCHPCGSAPEIPENFAKGGPT